MTKRKLMLVALSLCMVAILAMGGTLAYLTDDEQITNTFTVGDIEINIEEFGYKDGKFYPFADNTQLMPLDSELGNKTNNKIVYTFNTSKSGNAAYIRTIVLFEKNPLLDSTYVNQTPTEGDPCCWPGIHYGYHSVAGASSSSDGHDYYGSKSEALGSMKYNGKEYWVTVFTDANSEPIPANAALYSLAKVWMDKNITSDLIKGWEGNIDIIVCSQGIQADGLTHEQAMTELGEVNETNLAKWLSGANEAVINNYVDK